MNASISLENQILTTKFYVPVRLSSLISRPRLTSLLDENLKYPLTLVSAAAGFGKTTLLASWSQSLPSDNPRVAWVSLDEEDNEPRLFWAYVLTALQRQLPERFSSLLMLLQSPQAFPLNSLLVGLINALMEGEETCVLILDDYHVITEQQVHTTLTYLIEHLPPQLRIIVATRADPALPLATLRARHKVLEVRTNHLRCNPEETRAFLGEVMGLSLPEETIQEVTTRTEGWLVGLQLLSLSLPDQVNSVDLLKGISGDQSYILDYLTEEVLHRQPQEVQTFLLCTSILEERLTASLCDAVMEQTGSQQMLHQIEQANLFVVSLDTKRQWYRYHDLFAQALQYQLEQKYADLVLLLHHRASLWYAEHDQMTEAILHALQAQEWQWAAELIEHKIFPLISHTWGASHYALALLQQWVGQLPAEVMHARPLLCIASALLLLHVAPFSVLDGWFDVAEAILTASLTTQMHGDALPTVLPPQMLEEQKDLLGAIFGPRAVLRIFEGDGWTALALCEQALTLVSVDNLMTRSQITLIQAMASFESTVNDAVTAVQMALQAVSLARGSGMMALTLHTIGSAALFTIGAGQLHETQQLTQQAMLLAKQPGEPVLPNAGYPSSFQAEVLREWNELDAALTLAEEATLLSQQSQSHASTLYLAFTYAVLLRVYLSRSELDAARSALEEFEHICMQINQPSSISVRSFFTAGDQIRLWLACGELNRATRWAEELDLSKQHSNPYVHERQGVACVRVLLAKHQSALALERLDPVLQRATIGKRWGHVIEIRLLQALAHQMHQEETKALDALAEAVRLGEPEGYIRSFVDEGAPMEALLYQLRRRNRKKGPTLYLDTLLAAFQRETKGDVQVRKPSKVYQLPEPLSGREQEVLQLLVSGASNQQIAQELVIAVDTVKRHTSHIFSKLGVHNRIQAVLQARELGLLGEEV